MFEDFFTIYNMIEPPKIYKDDVNLEIQDNNSVLNNTTAFADINYPGILNPFEQYNYNNFLENEFNNDLIKLDIEDLLKQEGITEINGKAIRFGSKLIRTSNIGSPNSWHRKKDSDTGNASARDISIVGGTIKDYADFRLQLLNNSNIQLWMRLKGWGIINEITSEILSLTKGTGMHFHFGPDQWARNTWKAWNDNPSSNITTSFKNYTSSNNFNNKQQFINTFINVYEKALLNRGLDSKYALMLVALDAFETSWGQDIKGNFNYGNITATKNEPWHKLTGKRKWRDFDSIEDYVNSKIDFLSRDRYKFFLTFNSDTNIAVAMQILANRGYDPNNPNYGKLVEKVYKTILNYEMAKGK